jgi:hypothetical protein
LVASTAEGADADQRDAGGDHSEQREAAERKRLPLYLGTCVVNEPAGFGGFGFAAAAEPPLACIDSKPRLSPGTRSAAWAR